MKTILCIDGGGMRGYLPAAVLVELERRTGRRCCELFDLMAGTSIGGILAALLATGMPASEAQQFFTADGPQIFKRSWWRRGLFGPKYSAAALEATLSARLAGRAVQTRLLIPALDLQNQTPFFFKFSPRVQVTYQLWEAARATSSAQTYFPAFQADFPDGRHVFWDGGNVANNPAVCAYAEAAKLWDDRVLMLSLGCGRPQVKLEPAGLIHAGLLKNGLATVELLFAADSGEVDYEMEELLGGNYIRIQADADLPLDDATPAGLAELRDAGANHVRAAGRLLERFILRGG